MNSKPKFNVVDLGIVVAFLVMIAIPVSTILFGNLNSVKKREACLKNLKRIGEAQKAWKKQQRIEGATWHISPPAFVLEGEILTPTNYFAQEPRCLSLGTYSIPSLDEKPRCSVHGVAP
ncbi:MAG: hypothetical protein ABI430_02960 [Candidatus Taylorbacteria bacterium]